MSEVTSPEPKPEFVWKFGYGSNLSPTFLEAKKGFKVYEWHPAKLSGWALVFNMVAFRFTEPAFANIVPGDATWDSVHGSICLLSKSDCEVLDNQERAYQNKIVTVQVYDGRELEVEAYVGKETASPAHIFPSKRYLNLIIDGAKEVGLEQDYIDILCSLPSYTPSPKVLRARKAIPRFEDLPKMTIAELAERKEESEAGPPLSSILGYIFNSRIMFKFYYGRDTTFRRLLHYRGISMDLNDDGGKSPFPVQADLSEDELEYLWQSIDEYLSKGSIVAVLKEYWDDQNKV